MDHQPKHWDLQLFKFQTNRDERLEKAYEASAMLDWRFLHEEDAKLLGRLQSLLKALPVSRKRVKSPSY